MPQRSSFEALQDEALKEIYLELRVPSDDLPLDAASVSRLKAQYEARTLDTSRTGKQLCGRIITLRKNRKLPRLGR